MIATLIIKAYRNGPLYGRIFGHNGNSTAAMNAINGGMNPWKALWRYGRLTMPFPSWTDPGPQG